MLAAIMLLKDVSYDAHLQSLSNENCARNGTYQVPGLESAIDSGLVIGGFMTMLVRMGEK